MFVLALLAAFQPAHPFSVSVGSPIFSTVSNVTTAIYTATISYSDADGTAERTFTINNGESSTEIGFAPQAPRVRYSYNKVGYVPFQVIKVEAERCITQPNANISLLLSNFVKAQTGFTLQEFKNAYGSVPGRTPVLYGGKMLSWASNHYQTTPTSFRRQSPRPMSRRLMDGGAAAAGAKVFGTALLGGIAGGIFGSYLFCDLLSQCGGGGVDADTFNHLTNQVKDLSNKIDDVTKPLNATLNDLENINGNLSQWATSAESLLNAHASDITTLKSETLDNTAAIANLSSTSTYLRLWIGNVSLQMNSQFGAQQSQISGLVDQTTAIGQAVILLGNQTSLGFIAGATRDYQLALAQRAMLNQMYFDEQDLTMRRMLTQQYHQIIDTTPFPLNMRVFTTDTGQRPLSWAQRLALRNLANADRVSTVRVQYTTRSGGSAGGGGVWSGGTYTAHDTRFLFICDADFALNNTAGMDMQSMFRFLGPDSLVAGQTCYQNNVNQTWSCNCVLQIVDDTCTIQDNTAIAPLDSSANGVDPIGIWPFGWDSQDRGMANQSQTLASHPSVMSRCKTLVTSTTIGTYTNTGDFNTDFSTICLNSISAIATAGNNRRVRIWLNDTTWYMDYTQNSTYFASSADQCIVDWPTVQQAVQRPIMRLSTIVYVFWGEGFDIYTKYYQPLRENTIYGTMGAEVRFNNMPFSRLPGIVQAARCMEMTFTLISDTGDPDTTKTPVYALEYQRTDATINMRVNGASDYLTDTDGTLTTSFQALGGLYYGNLTTISDVTLVSSDNSLLPSADGAMYIDTGLADRIVDVPFELFSFAYEPDARCNHVNYLFEDANWDGFNATSQINSSRWYLNYNTRFDARCASVDPARYLRILEDLAPGYSVCGYPDYTYTGGGNAGLRLNQTNSGFDVVLNFGPCKLRERFLWSFDYVNGYLDLYPVSYTGVVQLQVPGGTWVETVTTKCPDGFNITRANGRVIVQFTTLSPDPLRLLVVVSSNSTSPGCNKNTLYTYSLTSPLLITDLTACGQQFVQAYPYQSSRACYPGAGIYANSSTTPTQLAGMQSTTAVFVWRSVESTASTMLSVQAILDNLNNQVNNVPYIAQTIDDLRTSMALFYANASRALANFSTNDPYYAGIYAQFNAAILANQAAVQQRIEAVYNSSTALTIALASQNITLADLYAAGNGLRTSIAQFNIDAELTRQALTNLSTWIEQQQWIYAKVTNCDGFAALTCWFTDIFGSVFGLIGNIIRYLVMFLMVLGIVYLLALLLLRAGFIARCIGRMMYWWSLAAEQANEHHDMLWQQHLVDKQNRQREGAMQRTATTGPLQPAPIATGVPVATAQTPLYYTTPGGGMVQVQQQAQAVPQQQAFVQAPAPVQAPVQPQQQFVSVAAPAPTGTTTYVVAGGQTALPIQVEGAPARVLSAPKLGRGRWKPASASSVAVTIDTRQLEEQERQRLLWRPGDEAAEEDEDGYEN